MNIAAGDFVRRLAILITIRFFLGIVFLLVVFIFSMRGKYDLSSPLLLPLYIYGVALLFFTIVGGIIFIYFRKQPETAKKPVLYGYLQLALDIFSVSLFVYLSGGVISPFVAFYIPLIIMGSMLFGIRGGILTGALCFISYGFILICQFYGVFQVYHYHHTRVEHTLLNNLFIPNLVVNIVSFGITALLSGLFVEKWHIAEEHFKNSLSQLRFLRSLHENILDNIPSGVMVINQDRNIIYANRMAEQILGVPVNKLLKSSIDDYIKFPFKLEDVTSFARKEMNYTDPTGETKILGYTIHSLKLSQKAWILIFLFQDLTEVKRLQKNVEETERMSLIGRIAANIAHNIKNPLGAIHGAAQLIKEEEPLLPPILKKAGDIIIRETKKIDAIVQDFLKLSLASLPVSSRDPIRVSSEIEKICHKFYTHSSQSNSYRINIKNELPNHVQIYVNPSDFEVVIWNLLLNAADAMPNGGNIDVKISPGSESPPQYIEIAIRDYGAGIPPEIQEKIFQPFFTTKAKGTGLGLSIVNQIVRKYNGLIYVTSKPGEGSTFFVRFPLYKLPEH
jgi:two-component system sensor histidine kinase PilS (NtrC family)